MCAEDYFSALSLAEVCLMTAQTYTALLHFDVACKYFPRLGAFALKVPFLESLKDHA